MDTLLLDRTAWDCCIDANGNIAMAREPYSTLQDVASACRVWLGELYYGPSTDGIPYKSDGLGSTYPTQLLRAKLVETALTVPNVSAAKVYLTSVAERAITGQIQVTLTDGTTGTVAL